jgi:hypothetical protein
MFKVVCFPGGSGESRGKRIGPSEAIEFVERMTCSIAVLELPACGIHRRFSMMAERTLT